MLYYGIIAAMEVVNHLPDPTGVHASNMLMCSNIIFCDISLQLVLFQTEAPLLIRPLVGDMTRSELHAIMTGGFATIAGSVLGAYIAFGVGLFKYEVSLICKNRQNLHGTI